MNAIPEEWIKKYVDTLTDTAASLPVGPFRDAVAMRAEHAMDLVKAWRESAAVQPDESVCRIVEYDGAFKCLTHKRLWGAVLAPHQPCKGWSSPDKSPDQPEDAA